jgi:hypothetical protein
MAKSSNKESTLSSHLLSQKHPKMKKHSHLRAKELVEIQPLLLYIGPPKNDWSAPILGVTTQALTGAFWSTHEIFQRMAAHPSGLRVLPTQAPRSCCVLPASKLLGTLARLCPPSLRSCFCGATKEPDDFVVNRHKPRGFGVASTPSSFWLDSHVIPAQCWFCGQINKPSFSTSLGNRGTRRFSGEPPKTPHGRHSLTMPSIGPAKPLTSSSRTVYSVLPRSMAWLLSCTGFVFMTSSCFSCHHAARTWSRRPPGPSNKILLVSPLLGGHRGIDLSHLFFICTTQIKLQPSPAILGQESVHTMLSITHHTKERPSTGPRTC